MRLANALAPRDRQFFDLFEEAGGNILRAAALLDDLLEDYPERNDAEWFCHAQLKKDEHGAMTSFKRPIEPYVVPVNDTERNAYRELRIAVPA